MWLLFCPCPCLLSFAAIVCLWHYLPTVTGTSAAIATMPAAWVARMVVFCWPAITSAYQWEAHHEFFPSPMAMVSAATQRAFALQRQNSSAPLAAHPSSSH